MKIYKIIMLNVFLLLTLVFQYYVSSDNLALIGKTIVIDPGHGGKDPGTLSGNAYEKDLNLEISLKLEEELVKEGARVILTRTGDYDLSSPNATLRKRSDFDNRISLINNSNAYIYLSIHLNYLSDSRYYGPQIFYNNTLSINKDIANILQDTMNKDLKSNREVKLMKSGMYYMYNKLKVPGVLVECGFLSNRNERNKLLTDKYQNKLVKSIKNAIINIE